MLEFIQRHQAEKGAKAAIVSIDRLQEIKEDIERLKRQEDLNHFQQYITHKLYVFDLPEADFTIRSILMVAAPAFSYRPVVFHKDGKRYSLKSTSGDPHKGFMPKQLEAKLGELLQPHGYHVRYERKLPYKRLAVRGGLAEYGRNNITYVKGFGSFYSLTLFFTDLPSTGEGWHEVCSMERCEACGACIQSCPTGAIRKDRFLIDNMKCLTYFNETGKSGEFPEWIPKEAHNCVFECLQCQLVCPENKAYVKNTAPELEFDEAETAMLLSGASYDELPSGLQEKLEEGWVKEYAALARNLKVLIND